MVYTPISGNINSNLSCHDEKAFNINKKHKISLVIPIILENNVEAQVQLASMATLQKIWKM